jgi:hypothetical protein
MRVTPFLELKLNATPVAFLLEVFRLCDLYMSASKPPQNVVQVEVRLPDQPRFTRDRNIKTLSRQELEKFTGSGSSAWTLLFHVPIDDEATWKNLFEFELIDIGGDLPLLISLLGFTHELHAFATTFVARCLTLWDAKFVHIHRDAEGFVEKLIQSLGRQIVDYNKVLVQAAASAQRESQEKDRELQSTEPWQETPNAVDGLTSPVTRPAGATQPPRKIREGTAENLERLKALFEEKKQGTRRNLSWSRACEEAGTTVKTAGVYLPDIKAQWITMDKAQNKRRSTKLRKRPGRK